MIWVRKYARECLGIKKRGISRIGGMLNLAMLVQMFFMIII